MPSRGDAGCRWRTTRALDFGDAYDADAADAERMINSFAAYLLAPRAGVTKGVAGPSHGFGA